MHYGCLCAGRVWFNQRTRCLGKWAANHQQHLEPSFTGAGCWCGDGGAECWQALDNQASTQWPGRLCRSWAGRFFLPHLGLLESSHPASSLGVTGCAQCRCLLDILSVSVDAASMDVVSPGPLRGLCHPQVQSGPLQSLQWWRVFSEHVQCQGWLLCLGMAVEDAAHQFAQ